MRRVNELNEEYMMGLLSSLEFLAAPKATDSTFVLCQVILQVVNWFTI